MARHPGLDQAVAGRPGMGFVGLIVALCALAAAGCTAEDADGGFAPTTSTTLAPVDTTATTEAADPTAGLKPYGGEFVFAVFHREQAFLVAYFLFGKLEQYFFHAGFFSAFCKAGIKIGRLLFLVDSVVEYFINGVHIGLSP